MVTLRALVEELKLIAEEESNRSLVACPHDGTPLEQGPRNTLHCPFSGHTFDANAKQNDN